MNEETPVMDYSHQKKHVTWDEKTIAEHDKERGTHMVINEPKTPYNRLGIPENEEDEEKEEAKLLIERLQELERVQAQQRAFESEQQSKKVHIGFVPPPEKAEGKDDYQQKHADFLKKRKLHYNEYQEVMRLRKQQEEEEDEEEEDEV